jgi:uncharacterized protein (DUF433 family)
MSLSLASAAPPLRYQGDSFRVGHSNVTLETVVLAYQNGSTPEQIVECFPTVALADVYDVVAYYLRHQVEVEAYMAEQERQAEATVAEVQRLFPNRISRAELERRLRR